MNMLSPVWPDAAQSPPLRRDGFHAGMTMAWRGQPAQRRDRFVALSVSVAAHLIVAFLLLHMWVSAKKTVEPPPISVSITETRAAPAPSEASPLKFETPPLKTLPEPTIPVFQAAPVEAAPATVASLSKAQPNDAPATLPRFDAAYLNNPQPVYPNMSRRLRESGTVQLHVLVSSAGLPVEVTVSQSSGYARLDEAALAAVRQWRFQAATQKGMAVSGWVIVPVEFSLTRGH